MSTIWDYAVRALQAVQADLDSDGRPLSYYCGGPGPKCQHHACRVVSALAEEALLNYDAADVPDGAPATDTAVEIATDVVGHHRYDYNRNACACSWKGSTTEHPGHVARRLATVGVLSTSGAP
jgi:hypothetical protein